MNKLVQLLEHKTALIVSLPGNSLELFQAAVEAGADAVKVHFNIEHRASGVRFGSTAEHGEMLGEMCRTFNGPIGAVAGDSPQKVTPEEIDRLITSGVDFVSLYAHHAPGWLLTQPGISKLIAVDRHYDEALSRAYRSLPIEMLEASVVPSQEYGTPLSIRDLLHYRSLVECCGKPVIVPTQRNIQVGELEALRLTGIKGIMIGAIVTGTDAKSIYEATREFRRGLDQLTR